MTQQQMDLTCCALRSVSKFYFSLLNVSGCLVTRCAYFIYLIKNNSSQLLIVVAFQSLGKWVFTISLWLSESKPIGHNLSGKTVILFCSLYFIGTTVSLYFKTNFLVIVSLRNHHVYYLRINYYLWCSTLRVYLLPLHIT